MKTLNKIITAGILFTVLYANTAFGALGFVREGEGYSRAAVFDNEKIVMTDGNNDGILDRVDIYSGNKKIKTIYRDLDDELTEGRYDSQGNVDFITTEDSIKEFKNIEQNLWYGRC